MTQLTLVKVYRVEGENVSDAMFNAMDGNFRINPVELVSAADIESVIDELTIGQGMTLLKKVTVGELS